MNEKLLPANGSRLLPKSYVLSKHDVLCGRGWTCFNYEGSRRFRKIVRRYSHEYERATGRNEKGLIIRRVVDVVRANSGLGGFIKIDPITKRASEVGDYQAREKTSQAFRDALEDQYQSSNASKQRRRASSKAAQRAKKIALGAAPADQTMGNTLRSTIDPCKGTDMGSEVFHKNIYVSLDTEGLGGTPIVTCARSSTTSGHEKMDSCPNSVCNFHQTTTLASHPPKPLHFCPTGVIDYLRSASVDEFFPMEPDGSFRGASEDAVPFEKLCEIVEYHQTTIEDPFEPVPLEEVFSTTM